MAGILEKAVMDLGATAMEIGGAAMSERFETAFAHASVFLEVTGDLVLGWMHLMRACAAAAKTDLKKKDQSFYTGIVTSARFYMETVLPVTAGKTASIRALSDAALAMEDKAYG